MKLEDRVLRYFSAVDQEDIETLLGTLSDDCVFRVETHNVELIGHDAIRGMFERLWSDHKAVRHENFRHVADPEQGRIASQFKVVNTHHDGSLTHKSNCKFFTEKDGKFCAVSVYMTGQNTLS